MPSGAKNIAEMDLGTMIKERERKMQAIARLKEDLSEAQADLSAINAAIAKELGITGGSTPALSRSSSESRSGRSRMSGSELSAAQAEVLDIITKAGGPIRRSDIALRLSRQLKPTQMTNILDKLVADGNGPVKRTGAKSLSRYEAK